MNVAYRRQQRYGNGYATAKKIEAAIKNSAFRGTPLILLPPNTYFRANMMAVEMPEPAVFYNYTGLQAIWKNSDKVKAATHIVEVTPKGMTVTPVCGTIALIDTFLARYAAYDIAL